VAKRLKLKKKTVLVLLFLGIPTCLWDQRRSNEIREEFKTEDVVRWTRARRRYWNEHNSRMNNHSWQWKISIRQRGK